MDSDVGSDFSEVKDKALRDLDLDEGSQEGEKSEGSSDDSFEDPQRKARDEAVKEQEKSTTSLRLIVKKKKLYICLNVTRHVESRSYVYFLLRQPGPVPDVQDFEEAVRVMPGHFELGYFKQHPLVCIDKMVSQLYAPLLSDENAESNLPRVDSHLDDYQLSLLLSNFLKNVEDFTDSTREIMQQTQKPLLFSLPEALPDDVVLEELAQEGEYVSETAGQAREWGALIENLLADISKEVPPDSNLLNEIEFWKTQMLRLNICSDQLSHVDIQKTLRIMRMAEENVADFETNAEHLENRLERVADNVRYLLLLEKSARKLLSIESDVDEDPKKLLSEIFVGLRVTWMQSDYYGEATNFLRLLCGVTACLKEQVRYKARIDELFRRPLPEVRTIVGDSVLLLQFWKERYFQECEEMKRYGDAFWWGFDVRSLFDETDYMVEICQDLESIAKVLQELYNIFSTNLRYYVEDMKELKSLENRIFGMAAIIQYSDLDPFDRGQRAEWVQALHLFQRDVGSYEAEVRRFVGRLLGTLSWEDGYALADSFGKVPVSEAMADFIARSRADLLKQFVREIAAVENEFLSGEQDPPLFDLIPSTASAILWSGHLLERIAHPMSRIRGMLGESGRNKEVVSRFVKTEKILKNFKQEKYEAWKDSSSEKLNKFLHSNLMRRVSKKPPLSHSNAKMPVIDAVSYTVLFPKQLEQVSQGAKILENLGYEIPNMVNDVILQERTFYKHRNKLTMILEDLQESVLSLKKEEISMMSLPIESLCEVLDLGIDELRWESTNIPDFLINAKKAVDVFKGLVQQVKNITIEVDKRIQLLESRGLFEFAAVGDLVPTRESYFGEAEMVMNSKLEDVVNLYRSLIPLLRKLEMICCKISTGKSEHMSTYYHFCEEKILSALVKMMLSNLEYFKDEIFEHFIFPYVRAAFQSEEELVTSSIVRIKLVFVSFMKLVIESTRKLKRWIDGTCVEAESFRLSDGRTQMEFSYFLDLSLHPGIKRLTLKIISSFFSFVNKMAGQ